MKLKIIFEVFLILALVFLLFYGLLLWSARNGGVETTGGTLIFLATVILFVSPVINKAIELWFRAKVTKLFANTKELASIINFAIVVVGFLVFLWFTINESKKFDLSAFVNHIWQLFIS